MAILLWDCCCCLGRCRLCVRLDLNSRIDSICIVIFHFHFPSVLSHSTLSLIKSIGCTQLRHRRQCLFVACCDGTESKSKIKFSSSRVFSDRIEIESILRKRFAFTVLFFGHRRAIYCDFCFKYASHRSATERSEVAIFSIFFWWQTIRFLDADILRVPSVFHPRRNKKRKNTDEFVYCFWTVHNDHRFPVFFFRSVRRIGMIW